MEKHCKNPDWKTSNHLFGNPVLAAKRFETMKQTTRLMLGWIKKKAFLNQRGIKVSARNLSNFPNTVYHLHSTPTLCISLISM